MKYIAVFEIPDDEMGLLELTVSGKDGLTTTSLVEYKKAPKPKEVHKPEIHYADDFEEYGTQWIEDIGYNQGLKDCGVIENGD